MKPHTATADQLPSKSSDQPNAQEKLGKLLESPHIWRASDSQREQQCEQQTQRATATGFPTLDQELPEQGWPQHGLVELLCPRWGIGEIPLLSSAMAQLSQQGRWLVWVSPPWLPYAPGLLSAGMNLKQLLVIKTQNDKDCLWAMEECLQSGSCSAVLGWPQKPLPQHLKRLHIAAQKGDSLCWLMRPENCSQQPSPAPLRIAMGTLQGHLSLRILKRRGSWASDWIKLPLPDYLSLLEKPVAKLSTQDKSLQDTNNKALSIIEKPSLDKPATAVTLPPSSVIQPQPSNLPH